jgi:hypothetical protein
LILPWLKGSRLILAPGLAVILSVKNTIHIECF